MSRGPARGRRETEPMANSWAEVDKALEYLARVDSHPHRAEGEAILLGDVDDVLPGRVLDLGCGDGRLAALVLAAAPQSTVTCVDMSPPMLEAVASRFTGDARVHVVAHDFEERLPFTGPFDAVVSSLAIHHVTDARKQTLYAEIAGLLSPGGVFENLEIVASPTRALHDRWRVEMGACDDPSDILRDMPSQLAWMEAAGLRDVDCIWKWRSLALLRGQRPG